MMRSATVRECDCRDGRSLSTEGAKTRRRLPVTIRTSRSSRLRVRHRVTRQTVANCFNHISAQAIRQNSVEYALFPSRNSR